MTNENKLYNKYLLNFFIILLFLSIPILFNIIFVFKSGENISYSKVAILQQKENSIYGSALNSGQFNYKLELAKSRKTNIVSIGSSRVLSFREEFFKENFTNLGGVISNLTEGDNFIKSLYKFDKPEIAIIGLDYWWFNEGVSKLYQNHDGTKLTYDKLVNPIKWIYEGKYNYKFYISSIFGKNNINNLFFYPTIGLRASINGEGFRKDGSIHYGKDYFSDKTNINNSNENLSALFQSQLLDFRIRGGKPIENFRLNEFNGIIDKIKKNGTHVIIFIPPVAPILAKKMRNDRLFTQYFNNLNSELKRIIPAEKIYNFHNFDNYYDNNCEFIDSYHGGEVTYLRILKEISKTDAKLNSVLNIKNINEAISKFNNHGIIIENSKFYKKFEYDYLGLKCNKDFYIQSVDLL